MGIFSSAPRNRKRRTLRKRNRDWIHESEASSAPRAKSRKASTPQEHMHRLNAQIGAIETFLHQHHQAEVQRQVMRRENILPPPDRSSHRQARKKMNLAAKRKYNAERNRTSFRFFLLFCTACTLVWWLVFSGL